MAGVPHNLPVQAAAAIHFFGLDTAVPTTVPPTTGAPGTCTATVVVTSSWQGGFVATVRVTAGATAINGWRVTLTLPAGTAIATLWNGQASGTSGTVQVTNLSYNGRVGAGQTTEFGFQATGPGPVTTGCTAS